MATTITAYVFLKGRCEEALGFYKEKLGAEVEMVMRFDQSPHPAPEGMLQAGFETKVMHASFTVGGARVMASDGCNDQGTLSGFRLALSVATQEEARKAFDGLADGGTVDMPLTETFWSPLYGMVTDRFGVEWMVSVPGPMG